MGYYIQENLHRQDGDEIETAFGINGNVYYRIKRARPYGTPSYTDWFGVKRIKPHGRLIDADAFLKRHPEFADREFDHPKFQDTLRELIDAEPTVIESDYIDIDRIHKKGTV